MSISLSLYEDICKIRAGGATTMGVTRTIVATDLSQTEVFLREAVQNSYDAKLDNNSPLQIKLNCFKLSQENCDNIKTILSNAGTLGRTLSQKINSSFYNLEFADRNTTGLSGYGGFKEHRNPKSMEEEKFHHFVYITGNDDVKNRGSGGSFGYGKIALYKYSDLRTIVIYSRVKSNNNFESRFIISKIDEREPEEISRCWWGKECQYTDNIPYAKPLIGKDADDMASLFGLSPFLNDETGTDILLLNPIPIKDKDFKTSFSRGIPCFLTHWFWPKIITTNISKKIEFSLSLDGEDITYKIPNPREVYPYRIFSRAFDKCTKYYAQKKGNHIPSENVSPNNSTQANPDAIVAFGQSHFELGGIFLTKTITDDFLLDDYIKTDWTQPRVALMRNVEFIVTYMPVAAKINNTNATCFGLFHTTDTNNNDNENKVESYFREIENQTHDKWTHAEYLPDNYLYKVKQTIRETVIHKLDIGPKIESSASVSGLVAQKLGEKLGFGFIGGASKPMPEFHPSSSSSKKTKKTSTFTRSNSPIDFKIINGKKVMIIKYEANIKKGKKLFLCFSPKINTINGESEPAEPSELEIKYLQFNSKDGTSNIINLISGCTSISETAEYNLYLETKIQCAFDITVEKKEIDG